MASNYRKVGFGQQAQQANPQFADVNQNLNLAGMPQGKKPARQGMTMPMPFGAPMGQLARRQNLSIGARGGPGAEAGGFGMGPSWQGPGGFASRDMAQPQPAWSGYADMFRAMNPNTFTMAQPKPAGIMAPWMQQGGPGFDPRRPSNWGRPGGSAGPMQAPPRWMPGGSFGGTMGGGRPMAPPQGGTGAWQPGPGMGGK